MLFSTVSTRKTRAQFLLTLALSAFLLTQAEAQQPTETLNGGKAFEWILRYNPELQRNFLTTELPDKRIVLPNGQVVPIFRLKQFLDCNFPINWSSRRKEGVQLVETQERHLRKLMARPEFYHWIRNHRSKYKIAGKGDVSSLEAYNYLRRVNKRIYVTVSDKVKAPVGGGNGINAPSWAVWRQMNLFWHESCHCIGIGHNSGGISGPLAGKLRDWDRKHMWNYELIDLDQLAMP